MKKLETLLGSIGLLLLLAACGLGRPSTGEPATVPPAQPEIRGEVSDPTPGTFRGTTSQGESITLVVGEVGGALAITSLQYKIKVTGSGWSATNEYVMPYECEVRIESGRFSGYAKERPGDSSAELSGAFSGDAGVQGRLKESLEHPQGLGTAVGDVTFTARKEP